MNDSDKYVILYDRIFPMEDKWSYGLVFYANSKKDMIDAYNRMILNSDYSDIHMYEELDLPS